MDVPSCLVSSGVSLWLYSKFDSMGRVVCFGQLRRNLGEIMALPEVGSFEMGVTQGPDVFVFWVQPVLLLLDLAVLLLMVLSVILALLTSRVFSGLSVYTTVAVLLLLIIGVTAIILRQPQNPSPLHCKVSDLMYPSSPP